MIFLNAFTAFMTELFSSTFAAWIMTLLVFMFLLCTIICTVGDIRD